MQLARRVALAVALAVATRLCLAFIYPGNFDERSFEIVAAVMRRGGNVYAETSRYNYSPLWAYCLLVLSQLADALHWPLHAMVRSFLTLIDLGNAVMIGLIAEHLQTGTGLRRAMIYALNPVAILLVGYHGQIETLALMPLLVAVWLYLRSEEHPAIAPILILLAVSVLMKHLTVFLVWTIVLYVANPKKAIPMMLVTIAPFALSFLPYWARGSQGIMDNVVQYNSDRIPYGPLYLLPSGITLPLFLCMMAGLPVLARYRWRLPLAYALSLVCLVQMLLMPGIALQYFLLPLLLAGWEASPAYWAYSAVVTAYLVVSPFNVHWVDVGIFWFIGGPITWVMIGHWLYHLIRSRSEVGTPPAISTLRSSWG